MIEERFKHMIEIKSYGGRLMESRKPIPGKNEVFVEYGNLSENWREMGVLRWLGFRK